MMTPPDEQIGFRLAELSNRVEKNALPRSGGVNSGGEAQKFEELSVLLESRLVHSEKYGPVALYR
jgi:hypothetical protein